ncbi:hypothetical protein GOBAR_AA00994 [Gossypium barbadense]|uniref:trehalose-phosphatase n=1 Tax=Gossypium barbadense TaxID=3634 RepID=A0A2P5YVD5_GOSBA|nr:hypothetical protein GOBAR_AA00994 [Gossypium barbadense]
MSHPTSLSAAHSTTPAMTSSFSDGVVDSRFFATKKISVLLDDTNYLLWRQQLCGKQGNLMDCCYYRFDASYKSAGYRPPPSSQANLCMYGTGPPMVPWTPSPVSSANTASTTPPGWYFPPVSNWSNPFLVNASTLVSATPPATTHPQALIATLETVYSFVKLSGLYYAGSHDMDIKGPSKSCKDNNNGKQGVLFQPASEFLPMIDEVYKALVEKTKAIPGAKVENKFCVSVHYRCVDKKSWASIAEQVRSVLNHYPKLKLTQGRKVLEIRPTINGTKEEPLNFCWKH